MAFSLIDSLWVTFFLHSFPCMSLNLLKFLNILLQLLFITLLLNCDDLCFLTFKSFFPLLQADDVKWFGESEFWKIFPAPDYISDGYGCHSRILKAASQGMEKLTASLTYYTRHQESKEVTL